MDTNIEVGTTVLVPETTFVDGEEVTTKAEYVVTLVNKGATPYVAGRRKQGGKKDVLLFNYERMN